MAGRYHRVLRHDRNVVRRHVRMRESNDLVLGHPVRIEGAKETQPRQRLRRRKYVIDHTLEVQRVVGEGYVAQFNGGIETK